MSRLATGSRRNRFVILRTAGSPPVALHEALRRRSYLRLPGCDQPGRGLPPRRRFALTDALMAAVGPPPTTSADTGTTRRGWRACARHDGIGDSGRSWSTY